MARCESCGSAVQADDHFCGSCGAVVSDGEDALFDRPAASMQPETVRVDLDDEPTSTGADAPTEVIAVTGGVDLATCPSCDAVNAVERRRCARCGTPLHDDADVSVSDAWELQDLSSPPREDQVATAAEPRRSRWPGVVVVVLGALLGAVLGTWAFGVGPFERTSGVGIDFDGGDYPGQAEQVSPQRARTSQVRPDEGGRSFGAPSVVDGDLATAWVAADANPARLELAFDRPVWITHLEFANGDQFGEETFQATARVRTLDLDFGFGTTVRATLLSATGRQVVRPPEPILTDRVVMDVVDVTEGTGVALSEVAFVGYVANDQDTQAWDEAS